MVYTTCKNGDDWGMVQMALLYPTGGFEGTAKSIDENPSFKYLPEDDHRRKNWWENNGFGGTQIKIGIALAIARSKEDDCSIKNRLDCSKNYNDVIFAEG